jgi:hypothetical protein
MVQARDAETDQVMGSFATSEFHLMDCSGLKSSTVWLNNSMDKSEVTLKWMIPKDMAKEQKIVFKAMAMEANGFPYLLSQTVSNLI